MNYPSDFDVKLGFDQIRQKLESYCLSSLGAGLVRELSFYTDASQISVLLKQNLEFKQIFEKGENFPSNHYVDPDEIFKKTSLEGNYLDELEFLQLAYSLQTILACRDFLVKTEEFYPTLFQLTLPLTISKGIGQRILSVIDENATVKDSASAELSRIRKKLRDEQGRLRKFSNPDSR
jgi:DNA mismatch repair protein MutS2